MPTEKVDLDAAIKQTKKSVCKLGMTLEQAQSVLDEQRGLFESLLELLDGNSNATSNSPFQFPQLPQSDQNDPRYLLLS